MIRYTALLLSIALMLIVAAIVGLFVGVVLAPHARAQSYWDRPAVQACCSAADAVYADSWSVNPDGSITATVTGGGPRSHAWAPIGREYKVPADRILKEPGNPTGRPLLFLMPSNLSHVYCFAVGPMI